MMLFGSMELKAHLHNELFCCFFNKWSRAQYIYCIIVSFLLITNNAVDQWELLWKTQRTTGGVNRGTPWDVISLEFPTHVCIFVNVTVCIGSNSLYSRLCSLTVVDPQLRHDYPYFERMYLFFYSSSSSSPPFLNVVSTSCQYIYIAASGQVMIKCSPFLFVLSQQTCTSPV